ncbi:Hint domain-containing protein [Advenella incenata]
MSIVDIEVGPEVVVPIDQQAYEGDTVLNIVTAQTHPAVTGGSIEVSNVTSKTDALEMQFTHPINTEPDMHPYLGMELNSGTHVKLIASQNPVNLFEQYNITVNEGSTLELTPEFVSQNLNNKEIPINPNRYEDYRLTGLLVIKGAGDVIVDTTGLNAEDLKGGRIEYTPIDGGEITFVGATTSEYGTEVDPLYANTWYSNLVFKNDAGEIVGRVRTYIDRDNFSHFQFGAGTVSYYACYLKGTHIATPDGETKVEDLKAGDKVLTASGGTVNVKWLGYRTLFKKRIPEKDAKRAFPILFKKGCVADNVPHRDLFMSPGHHVSFDGNLVSAMNLVNGKSIVQLFDLPSFQYFHVELEQFDILLAEGVPAESYVDTGNRNMFQNAHEVAMNPDFGPAEGRPDIPGITVVKKGPVLEAIRAKLLERANWMQAPQPQKRVG